MKRLIVIALLFAPCVALSALPDAFVKAIHRTESSGRLGAILGDNGKALGPLQIHRACWQDSRVKGDYRQCADLDYSRQVMQAYLLRYCPQAIKSNDFETMARVWNGGLGGLHNKATLVYWKKVQSYLSR